MSLSMSDYHQIVINAEKLNFNWDAKNGRIFQQSRFYDLNTLGQKATFFFPEITKNLMFEKCEFCEILDFENVNFVRNEILITNIPEFGS